MLIEFSVSNFRSFRDKQTFSMVAAPRLKKRGNVFKPDVKGEKLPDLLKVAAIYGPNASGKSNLIKALNIVRKIVYREPSSQFNPFPVAPFRFDPELADQPSCIELHFIFAGLRYQFELGLTEQRIVHERLLMFPQGKETLLYERRHLSTGDHYTFGEQLEGGDDLHKLWQKATSPQVLFLAQAAANSSEKLKQLTPPLTWLQSGFLVIDGKGLENLKHYSQQQVEKFPAFSEGLAAFLQEVDVPIANIRTDKINLSSASLGLTDTKNIERKTLLTHRTELGDIEFDFEDESEGTKNLIGFWSAWDFHALAKRISPSVGALVVDELDTSLHPEIVVSLVEKHINAASPAQLIFTTHSTHLMDAKLLRRDQFWLTERDANGATQLRSIHDFAGREGEDLEKRYYEGRYRSLPFIRRG
ncbi:AAA family ATPase [Methylovulum psychrotolerans]|uniref:AAA family ATPase n=1 Tax=Methylovulum psychrotolerans TaxID=1704499 RepID=UPI001BFF9D8E|nr:ATP-binding protein [Methylovulum psychrotolerans]MBT9096652.1 AAA family ATPase [Methylovulum psychrotolerans]